MSPRWSGHIFTDSFREKKSVCLELPIQIPINCPSCTLSLDGNHFFACFDLHKTLYFEMIFILDEDVLLSRTRQDFTQSQSEAVSSTWPVVMRWLWIYIYIYTYAPQVAIAWRSPHGAESHLHTRTMARAEFPLNVSEGTHTSDTWWHLVQWAISKSAVEQIELAGSIGGTGWGALFWTTT